MKMKDMDEQQHMKMMNGGHMFVNEPPFEQRVSGMMFRDRKGSENIFVVSIHKAHLRISQMNPAIAMSSAPGRLPKDPRIHWSATLKLALLTLLNGGIIVGLGIARLLIPTRWAFGVEIAFGRYCKNRAIMSQAASSCSRHSSV